LTKALSSQWCYIAQQRPKAPPSMQNALRKSSGRQK